MKNIIVMGCAFMMANTPALGQSADVDYPAKAVREGREGVTGFHLKISAEGKIDSCQVTMSSGSTDLDEATCDLMLKRARFRPATNAKGEAIASERDSRMTWKIPR